MNPSTTALTLNMQLPNIATVSWAVQGDQLARIITATLVDGSTPWTPASSYHGVVRFHKPDGTSGVYDVDEDGNPAVTWVGNVATITIAQQALTCSGSVTMQLEFYDTNNARITAFGWTNNVQPSAVTDTEFLSTDYYNILSLQISAVLEVADEMTPYSNTPEMDGVGSPGTSIHYSRGNHVHPTDTSRASVADLATYVRPNLLDNWYFGNGVINQRGQSNYSGNSYAIDRWKGFASVSNLEIQTGYIRIKRSSGAYYAYTQIIDNIAPSLSGKTVTASILLKNVYSDSSANPCYLRMIDGSDTTISSIRIDGSTKLFSVTATLGALTSLRFAIYTGTTYLDVEAVKLEIGDTQTLANQVGDVWVLNEIPDYVEQLAKCQKYYISTIGFFAGFGSSSTAFMAFVPTCGEMAKAPSVSAPGGYGYFRQTSSHAITGVDSTSVLYPNGVRITGTGTSIEADSVGIITGMQINLSAEP